MSDELETIEATTEVAETETHVEVDSTDWKAEARKWEKRAKESRDAALKWQEYEKSLKPEQERLADELAAAKADAESARTALLRHEIAAEKGIPADAVKLLAGTTRDELESAADVLLSLVAEQSKPKTPKPDVSQGKPASGAATTADAFAAAIDGLL
jgi:hypothetical protein